MRVKLIFLIVGLFYHVNGLSIHPMTDLKDLFEDDYIFRNKWRAKDEKPNFVVPKANTTICYEYVGCFSNSYPFNNTANYLPVGPELINTEFILYTKQNPDQEEALSYRNLETIKNSRFNPALPLKVIVHGFSNNKNTTWIHEMKNTLLTDNVNVLVTFWGKGAEFPFYNNASSNIRVVGKELSLIVDNLRKTFFPNYPKDLNVHCIGHSLGAHTCGYASSHSSVRFNRITALDPAGPLFDYTPAETRIDPSDADFVDVYHTNGGSILYGSFGMTAAVGHVDFYVNGGEAQPGCPSLVSIIGSLFQGADPSTEMGCSHRRAVFMYTESIKSNCQFVGFKCKSQAELESGACGSCKNAGCTTMGYFADNFSGRGSFYSMTMDNAPFCGTQYLYEMSISAESNKTAGEIFLNVDPNNSDTKVQITQSGYDIKPKEKIKKVFVARNEFDFSNKLELTWNKKAKQLWQFTDPNALKFYFDKAQIFNLQNEKIKSKCEAKKEVKDKTPVPVQLRNDDCDI